jgi:hypothetical protein
MPVTSARRAVETQRATLARWEADQAAAEAELASLQQRAGDEILDAPDEARSLARSMQELRDQIDIAQRAVVAQRDRVAAAESAYLSSEADVLEQWVEKARGRLAAHQARTGELLAQLEQHEGRFVPEHQLIQERSQYLGGPRSWSLPKSYVFEQEVTVAERPVLILREMAAGRDPQVLVSKWAVPAAEVYPPCVWGSSAVVHAPVYLRTLENRRAAQDALELQSIPALERQVAKLEEEVAAAEARGATRELQPAGKDLPPTITDRLYAARKRLEEARSQAEAGRQALAGLTNQKTTV